MDGAREGLAMDYSTADRLLARREERGREGVVNDDG
jgi:hypothetical protein